MCTWRSSTMLLLLLNPSLFLFLIMTPKRYQSFLVYTDQVTHREAFPPTSPHSSLYLFNCYRPLSKRCGLLCLEAWTILNLKHFLKYLWQWNLWDCGIHWWFLLRSYHRSNATEYSCPLILVISKHNIGCGQTICMWCICTCESAFRPCGGLITKIWATVHVTKQAKMSRSQFFAAFLVPQGRDHPWQAQPCGKWIVLDNSGLIHAVNWHFPLQSQLPPNSCIAF